VNGIFRVVLEGEVGNLIVDFHCFPF
jgi:hypothetical protein